MTDHHLTKLGLLCWCCLLWIGHGMLAVGILPSASSMWKGTFFSFSALYTYCIAHLFCIFTCKVLPFLLKPCSAVTRSLNVVPCKKRQMSPQIFVFNFNLFFRKQTSWRFLLGCLQSRGSIKLPFMCQLHLKICSLVDNWAEESFRVALTLKAGFCVGTGGGGMVHCLKKPTITPVKPHV